jgi:septal ring factor EnvC (AmiA/AmiB activator)
MPRQGLAVRPFAKTTVEDDVFGSHVGYPQGGRRHLSAAPERKRKPPVPRRPTAVAKVGFRTNDWMTFNPEDAPDAVLAKLKQRAAELPEVRRAAQLAAQQAADQHAAHKQQARDAAKAEQRQRDQTFNQQQQAVAQFAGELQRQLPVFDARAVYHTDKVQRLAEQHRRLQEAADAAEAAANRAAQVAAAKAAEAKAATERAAALARAAQPAPRRPPVPNADQMARSVNILQHADEIRERIRRRLARRQTGA